MDLEPYRYSGVNMTGFRLLNVDHPWVASTMDRWAMERLQGPKQESGLMDGIMTVSPAVYFERQANVGHGTPAVKPPSNVMLHHLCHMQPLLIAFGFVSPIYLVQSPSKTLFTGETNLDAFCLFHSREPVSFVVASLAS